MELILENVRCFAERQTIPVKPLTLLVGENSAGKSTFLAMLSAASDPFGFPLRPRFNERPYNLGNYDTIATNRGGRAGLAKSFSFGYSNPSRVGDDVLQIGGTYRDNKGSIELAQAQVNSRRARMVFTFAASGALTIAMNYDDEGVSKQAFMDVPSEIRQVNEERLSAFLTKARYGLLMSEGAEEGAILQSLTRQQRDLVRQQKDAAPLLTLSVAPIRSEPKRTYTEVVEEFSPTGEHVPYVLEDVLSDPANRKLLEDFGRESGLFSKVAVKLWGKKRSDPLSVMVTNEGRPASSASNLSDVGYGVSQALPLVVQSILAAPESRLLLQQPEVHLHPRAQAALGTLFVDLVASTKKQFVVETHSDYIVDRVRQEVARGKVAASDVQILYFEREKQGTHVYPIDLDDVGNLVDVPSSYRSFFLQETFNFLSRPTRSGAHK